MAEPLQGSCLCGGVRFEITEPFGASGWCHCTHCQKRTGANASVNARVAPSGFRLLSGEELIRVYQPPAGRPKAFCSECGSALFSGPWPPDGTDLGIRLGLLDGDPGIRPQFRQYVRSVPAWDELPDDGLPRFEGPRG